MDTRSKILNLLNIFFRDSIKINLYKNFIFKIKKFSKKNFNFLTIDKFYFIFKKIDLDDLSILIYIVKYLNINIYKKFPFDNLINFYDHKNNNNKNDNYIFKKFFYKNEINFCSKDNIIKKKYKIINFYLNKISKILLNNIFFVNTIFRSNKKKTLKGLIYKIENLDSNLCLINNFFILKYNISKKFFKKKNRKNISKYNNLLYSNKRFNLKKNFSLLNFVIDNIVKYRLKNNNKHKILFKFLKYRKFKFKLNLDMIDCFFSIFIKKDEYFNKLKYEIYDFFSNVSNISYFKFNFFFLKYGSNLKWFLNLININDNTQKKCIYDFIFKKNIQIKNIEKKYSMNFRNIYKILDLIKSYKIKIDIIRNNIINKKIFISNKISKKYYNNENYNDILQESKIYLIKFINNYNFDFDIEINKYLIYNIKKHINKYVYGYNKLVRLPENIILNWKKIIKVINNYNNKHNKDPHPDYISKILNLSRVKLEKIMNFYKNPLSINNISENNESNFEEFLKNKKNFDFDNKIFNDDLSNYIEELTYKLNNNKLSNILSMRYGFNFSRRYSLAEVGGIYNLSRERIRQIQKEVLLKIKKISDFEKLENFSKNKCKYY